MIRRRHLPNGDYWLAALISTAMYVALHLRGTGLTPDGWAMWQAAVSLNAGAGYRYLSGHPILAWPPLYAAFLAGWMKILGASAATLIAANGVLTPLQAVGWCALARRTAPASGPRLWWTAAYIGLCVPLNLQTVLADLLLYTLLPWFLVVTWDAARSESRRALALASLLAAALVATHLKAVAFVGAALLLLALARKFGTLVIIGLVSAVTAIAVRVVVGHSAGQVLMVRTLFPGRPVTELWAGIGELLVPHRLGLTSVAPALIVAALAVAARADRGARAAAIFLTAASLGLVVLFSIVAVSDPLAGRFVLFVPLVSIPIVLSVAERQGPLPLLTAGALLMAAPLYWSTNWIVRQETHSLAELGYPIGFVPPRARLSREVLWPNAVERDNDVVLVAPHPWEEP